MRPRTTGAAPVLAILSALLTLGVGASSALGQGADFSTQATSTSVHQVPPRQIFDASIEEARWRLGVLRLAPWLGIRDATTVFRDGDEDEDFTITAGAGIRGYLRNGPKVVWAGHVLPEYTWWADDEDRREVNGRYGLGFFAYGNRLEVEVSHRRIEQQAFFSSELQRLTSTRSDVSRVAGAIELRPALRLLLSGQRSDLANQDDNILFSQLDRTETGGEIHLEYSVAERWRFSLGYQVTTTDFDERARALSNDSDAIQLGITFSGNRFAAELERADQHYDPQAGSLLVEADEVRGNLAAVWELSPHSFLQTYANRTLRFALLAEASHLLSSRSGLRWELQRNRLRLALFAEAGEDDYAPLATTITRRQDDVVSYGGSIGFDLGRTLRLGINARVTDYDSNLPGFDRDLTAIGFSFELLPLRRAVTRLTERLSIGDSGSVW